MEDHRHPHRRPAGYGGPKHFHNLGRLVSDFQHHLTSLGEQLHQHLNRPELPAFLQPLARLGGEIGQRFQKGPVRIAVGSRRRGLCLASLSGSLAGEGTPQPEPEHLFDVALSQEHVSRTLEGIPVYTVSNTGSEFVLVSDPNGLKSLSILCFRQQDAEALLSQVKDREPVLGRGAKVVAVSLDKVYKLTTEGIAFRFLPDPGQIKNAVEAKTKSGDKGKVFDGVPVFQSENLILRSSNRRFIPIFFCKEDLEKALAKASKQQQRANPSLRVNMDIQVGSFEDVLKKLEVNDENSGWGDFIFVPPGKDAVEHLGKALG